MHFKRNYVVVVSMFAHLHSVHLVSIVTYQPGELDLPDLVELLNGEGRRPAAVLVPETIAEPEKSFRVKNFRWLYSLETVAPKNNRS